MSPKKVLWLIKGLGVGGAERLVILMAPKMPSLGYEVEVAFLDCAGDDFLPALKSAGVPTHRLPASRTLDARWPWELRGLLRERHYDLVHTHSPVPGVAARKLIPRGTPIIHTEHNVWERYHPLTRAANAATYPRNAAALAVSDGVADSIRPPRWARPCRYPEVQTLIHGVDVNRVHRGLVARAHARDQLGLDPEAPIVGNVASLTPKKDHVMLLSAVEQLRSRHPKVRVLLIGSGPLEDELRRRVAEAGLSENIRFLGSRDDVLEILPALDVFVLSSRFEGLPISMMEAMASEVACVLTRVGGIPEAITDGVDGLLVAPGDASAMAASLSALLSEPAARERIGRAARSRVVAEFSIDRAVREHAALYDRLLGVEPSAASG